MPAAPPPTMTTDSGVPAARAAGVAARVGGSTLFAHEDRAVALLDTPARDRVERRRAQRLAGAQAEAGVVPRAAHGVADEQPFGRAGRRNACRSAPIANNSSPRRASSTASPAACPNSIAPSAISAAPPLGKIGAVRFFSCRSCLLSRRRSHPACKQGNASGAGKFHSLAQWRSSNVVIIPSSGGRHALLTAASSRAVRRPVSATNRTPRPLQPRGRGRSAARSARAAPPKARPGSGGADCRGGRIGGGHMARDQLSDLARERTGLLLDIDDAQRPLALGLACQPLGRASGRSSPGRASGRRQRDRGRRARRRHEARPEAAARRRSRQPPACRRRNARSGSGDRRRAPPTPEGSAAAKRCRP